MQKKLLKSALAFTAVAALLTGCSGGASGATSDGQTSANIYLYQAPESFNPLKPPMGGEQLAMSLVFDNLLTTGPDFEYVPRLAESWDISDDATEYTFHLREGMKWSDGEPFTAEDVVFSYTLFADPNVSSALRSRLAKVVGFDELEAGTAETLSGVQAIDDHTVKITLTEANAGFLSLIGYGSVFYILPEHVLGETDRAQLLTDSFFDSPQVGMGPYQIDEYKADQEVVLSANENYRTDVGIDTLYLKLLTSDVATAQLASGEIDLVQVSALDVGTVEGLDGVTVASKPSAGFFRLLPNFKKFPDERVRQAFLYAIDRQGIIDGVLGGHASPINSTIMTDWALPGDLNDYEYDAKKAKQLLTEAGFDFSQEIKVSWIPGQRDRDQMIDVVIANLKDAGVNAVAQQIDSATQLPMIENAEYDLMLSAAGVYTPDPASSFPLVACDQVYPAGSNTALFCNPDLDALMVKGGTTADQTARQSIYQDAARLDNQLVPMLWLSVPDTIWVHSDRLQGFQPHGDFTNGFWNAADWTVSS
ncbi:ABC transporter substrate-binding protein [Leucobacter sp. UT-8R-CII-1-4]|uniref:ABC transporter substrate-binding protein n=1 Tax=Leucobacter sp. UT-8R-CII-1-4 TaxID=3040075 RepID=UPI0024A82C9A|nr:ABC transporter substrate-binding protein [Leucobacter sp. UT-8R-CII-1-4]MDI6023412.1 ABC transporter substrate-binding protein [Leucobacter sp. UT-8R-CII-1-4]